MNDSMRTTVFHGVNDIRVERADGPADGRGRRARLAAVAADNFGVLAALLKEKLGTRRGDEPIPNALNGQRTIPHVIAQLLPGRERNYVPVSEHLFATLREPLAEVLPDDLEYDQVFDRFEILMSLAAAAAPNAWVPLGRFAWKIRSRDLSLASMLGVSADKEKLNWPGLEAGMFEGSASRMHDLMTDVREAVAETNWY